MESDPKKRDYEQYLAKIRKTIADSENLIAQTELRIAETDRMLEQQGLTREQVIAMRFTDAQMEAVNAELKRRGMDPLERWSAQDDAGIAEPIADDSDVFRDGPTASDAELENRQRKFGMMMKPFQI